MNNIFMEEFKKRLTKGLILGGVMALVALLYGKGAFLEIPWYIVPVVLVVFLLYGIGWYFAFNLVKRAWRKFLRVNRNASIWSAFAGRNFIVGFVYSMLCLAGGCFIAFIVGNYFALRDFFLAKQGKPPVSVKYKFDSDLEYDEWARDLSAIRAAVEYSDNTNSADSAQRFENEQNLRNIENGYAGTITTVVNEDGKKIEKHTTIY